MRPGEAIQVIQRRIKWLKEKVGDQPIERKGGLAFMIDEIKALELAIKTLEKMREENIEKNRLKVPILPREPYDDTDLPGSNW